jgi:hypothetical protein
MIKDPKQPAGNVARKVSGGFLDHLAAFLNLIALQVMFGVKQLGGLKRFIAKEDEFDGRMMLRLGAWGVGSIVTLIIAIIAVQSPASARRDQTAAEVTQQSQQVQRIAKDNQNQTHQLAAAMDTLNKDRDRLYNRVTVIEQALDSVNGSISKLATPPVVASASPPAAPAPVPLQASSQSTLQSQPALQSAALEPVATHQAEVPMASSQPSSDAKLSDVKSADTKQRAMEAKAIEAKTTEAKNAAESKKETTPAPKIASVSTVAPPTPPVPAKSEQKAEEAKAASRAESKAEAKLESKSPDQASAPDQVASVTGSVAMAAVPNADNDAEKPVGRTKFGIDLGSANSVEGLRALWRGARGPNRELFAPMQPLIVVKERTTGYGMQLRLVAGPLDDAAAAAKICATLTANSRRTCEPTVYDGQRLALRADRTNQAASNDPASTTNPSTADASTPEAAKTEAAKTDPTKKREASNYRRRGHVRTVAPPPAPAPAPPPQRWSLSSIFQR